MPTRTNLDMDVLRTFVTGFELGSFAKAADRLGRSQSAVSTQLRKLEQQVGVTLVHRSGRGLALTPAGQEFLSYARRLLELNDEAVGAMRASDLDGWVRLGLPHDFADRWLQQVLARFAKAHPRTKVEVHVDQSAALVEMTTGGKLDVALAWMGHAPSLDVQQIDELDASWIASPELETVRSRQTEPVRLVTADAPCAIRAAAITALDKAGMAWRIAVATPSFAGVWSAVQAGMGITLRPVVGMPATLRTVDLGQSGLPPPPRLPIFLLAGRDEHNEAVATLRMMVVDAVNDLRRT